MLTYHTLYDIVCYSLMSTSTSVEEIRAAWMMFENQAQVVAVNPILQAVWADLGLLESDSSDLVKLTQEIELVPTKPFIFEKAREGIEEFLCNGDTVVIWTQGDESLQKAKYNSSGLIDLEKEFPDFFRFYTSPDKIPQLTQLIINTTDDLGPVLVVDDKASNVLNSENVVRKAQEDDLFTPNYIKPVTVAWMRHINGRSRNKVPQGYKSPEDFMRDFLTVETMQELFQKRIQMISNRKITLLLDFDHTILWTAKWQEEVYKMVFDCLSKSTY